MLGSGWREKEQVGDHVKWPTEHRETGYWIASIWSPRIQDVETFDCGCAYDRETGAPRPADPDCRWCHGDPGSRSMGITWGLHAVVMNGSRLAWDPHPARDPNATLYFRSAVTFECVDPAKLVPRCRQGACGEGLIDRQDCYHRKG
jgi:hypothetical protein